MEVTVHSRLRTGILDWSWRNRARWRRVHGTVGERKRWTVDYMRRIFVMGPAIQQWFQLNGSQRRQAVLTVWRFGRV